MSNNLQTAFYEAMKQYLIEEEGYANVAEVTSVKEETYSSGYCDTCYYEEQVLAVKYINTEGAEESTTVWETFNDLLESLLKVGR